MILNYVQEVLLINHHSSYGCPQHQTKKLCDWFSLLFQTYRSHTPHPCEDGGNNYKVRYKKKKEKHQCRCMSKEHTLSTLFVDMGCIASHVESRGWGWGSVRHEHWHGRIILFGGGTGEGRCLEGHFHILKHYMPSLGVDEQAFSFAWEWVWSLQLAP